MPRRQMTTDFWDDDRVQDLTSTGQHVFMRLLFGPETGPAGATRAAAKRIAVDTNLPRSDVDAALEELIACGLVRRYEGGWLWLPSFIKHQLSGPQFIRGIRRQAAECPDALRKAITRATDAIVGPGKETTAENRRKRAADTSPPPDPDPRTGKSAPSRQESDSPPTDRGPSRNGQPSDTGLFEREGQDKDQDRPTGLSVLVNNESRSSNGDGPGLARGRPSPAQPPPTEPHADIREIHSRAREVRDMLRGLPTAGGDRRALSGRHTA